MKMNLSFLLIHIESRQGVSLQLLLSCEPALTSKLLTTVSFVFLRAKGSGICVVNSSIPGSKPRSSKQAVPGRMGTWMGQGPSGKP